MSEIKLKATLKIMQSINHNHCDWIIMKKKKKKWIQNFIAYLPSLHGIFVQKIYIFTVFIWSQCTYASSNPWRSPTVKSETIKSIFHTKSLPGKTKIHVFRKKEKMLVTLIFTWCFSKGFFNRVVKILNCMVNGQNRNTNLNPQWRRANNLSWEIFIFPKHFQKLSASKPTPCS